MSYSNERSSKDLRGIRKSLLGRNSPNTIRKTSFRWEDENDDVDTADMKLRGASPRGTLERSPDTDGSKHKLIAFTTDDFKIKRMVSSAADLPLNKYTSLGAIFQNKNVANTLSRYSYPVIKTPKDTLERHHILGPLIPGKSEEGKDKDPTSLHQGKVGPKAFPESERPEEARLGMPTIGKDSWDPTMTPHDGIVWPLAWAPRPPYTTPGYNRRGVKQPVGVIQVERVPVAPSKGNTDSYVTDLPTWVSPLYRSYGIGGPYGPFGPFYEPPSIEHVEDQETIFVEPPPKKCLIMRLWEGLRRKEIITQDKSIGMFLNMLDEKLMSIRNMLRKADPDEKKVVAAVVQGLSAVLDEAKDFEVRLDKENQQDDLQSLGSVDEGMGPDEEINSI